MSAISEAEVRALQAALPEQSFLSQFMRWVEYETDAHLAYALGAGLSLLSSAIETHVEIPFGAPVRGSSFTLLAGPSGDRKTVVARKAQSILEAVRPELISADHDSTQSLIDGLIDNPRQTLFMTEMGNWMARTRRGTHLEGYRELLCELWDGAAKSRKTLAYEGRVDKPALTVLACCAPSLFEKFASVEEMTGGFYSRFAVLHCERERFYPVPNSWPELKQYLIAHYEAVCTRSQGMLEHPPYDEDAYRFLWDWSHQVEAQRRQQEHAWTHGFYARMPVFAIKAALALSLDFGNAARAAGGPWRLGLQECQLGTRIADLFCRSSLDLAHSLAMGAFGREARAVKEAIGSEGSRDLSSIVARCRPAMSLKRVREVLETLVTSRELFSYQMPGGSLVWSATAPVLSERGVQRIEAVDEPVDSNVVVLPWARGTG